MEHSEEIFTEKEYFERLRELGDLLRADLLSKNDYESMKKNLKQSYKKHQSSN